MISQQKIPDLKKITPWFCLALLVFLPICAYSDEFYLGTTYKDYLTVSASNPFLPVLFLMGSVIGIITFFKPRIGLIIMLFFILFATDMPVGEKGMMQRSITVRIEDLILLLVSFGWLMNRAKTRTLSHVKDVPINKAILPMAIIIVLATLVGYFQGTLPPRQGFLFTMKRLEYFWIFFMTLNIIQTDKEATLAINILLVISVIVSCIGAFQYFLFPLSQFTRGGATSTTGFSRANTFADFLLVVIGLTMGLLIYTRNYRKTIIYSACLVLFLGSLVMTKSRGAYVSLLPVLVTFLAISRNRRAFQVLAVLSIVGLIYFVSQAMISGHAGMLVDKHGQDIKSQFSSIGSVVAEGPEADSSFNARYESWKDNIPRIMEYPLLGHGVGSIPMAYFDNHYGRELFETGFIGFIAFFFMNGVIFFTMLNFFHTAESMFAKSLALGFLSSLVGMLVHSITISNFYTILNMEAFWFICAIIMVLYYNQKYKTQAEKMPLAPTLAPADQAELKAVRDGS